MTVCADCWRRDHPRADTLNPTYQPTCEWRCPEHQKIWDAMVKPLLDELKPIRRFTKFADVEFARTGN